MRTSFHHPAGGQWTIDRDTRTNDLLHIHVEGPFTLRHVEELIDALRDALRYATTEAARRDSNARLAALQQGSVPRDITD